MLRLAFATSVDRSAGTAVAAVRTSARDELFAAEAHGAAAAVTRGDVDVYFVDKQISRQPIAAGRWPQRRQSHVESATDLRLTTATRD